MKRRGRKRPVVYANPEDRQYRDPATGEYAFDGRWARRCVCGHRLGDHLAGGFDCIVGVEHPGVECDCERFRPSRAQGPFAPCPCARCKANPARPDLGYDRLDDDAANHGKKGTTR